MCARASDLAGSVSSICFYPRALSSLVLAGLLNVKPLHLGPQPATLNEFTGSRKRLKFDVIQK